MNDVPRIKTRRASREDLPAVGKLWRRMMDEHKEMDAAGFALSIRADEEFRIYLEDILTNYLHAIFVATRGDDVVGYTIIAEMENPSVFRLKRYGFICEICVDPGCRGEGVGHILFERAMRWFKRRALPVVQLNLAPGNKKAKEFYEGLGFRPFLETLWLDLDKNSA